jgi:hypothetical protein
MPTVNFEQPAVQITGEPFTIPSPDGKSAVPATYAKILISILGQVYPDEKDLDWSERYQRGKLIDMLAKKETTYTIEQLASVKKLVGKWGSSQLVFQVFNLIDPPAA